MLPRKTFYFHTRRRRWAWCRVADSEAATIKCVTKKVTRSSLTVFAECSLAHTCRVALSSQPPPPPKGPMLNSKRLTVLLKRRQVFKVC
ncbi:hypothetical protein E2C01_043503 [Portunus trituberculatus]|uniref:Uncharacterized protein n=1 Tax=Portunus trituberculatus TaxID=210409 RepID=A0A5B7FQG6_PORTR|nr:hypothetical protein [Portunus trituberculatus]